MAGNGQARYAGDGGSAKAASLYSPQGLFFDGQGTLYIADSGNNCIRTIGTDGIIRTIAGTGRYGFSGDGGLSTIASLRSPSDVMVDRAGNIFIADTSNDRIRVIRPVTPPKIELSATSLKFTVREGFAAAAQTIQVRTDSPGSGYRVTVRTVSGGQWLSVTPESGTLPSTLEVSVSTAGIRAGTYNGIVQLSASAGTASASRDIAVELEVTPAVPPQISVETQAISFSFVPRGAPASSSLTVANRGGGDLSFTARATADWLSVTPASGVATPTTPASLSVTAYPGAFSHLAPTPGQSRSRPSVQRRVSH